MKTFVVNSPTYGKKVVRVDDEDYDRVIKYNWCVARRGKNIILSARLERGKNGQRSLHRFILGLGADRDIAVFHIDNDYTNNQKVNLRRRLPNEIINHGSYSEIIINSSKHGDVSVLFDTEDVDIISNKKWIVNLQKGKFYAYYREKCKDKIDRFKSMHRLIMKYPKNKQVDHIDSNTLDNRKINLRAATSSQNSMNRSIQSQNTSGYKGVSFSKKLGKYECYINIKKKRVRGGYFLSVVDAARKYNEMALIYHGEFARLNPIL